MTTAAPALRAVAGLILLLFLAATAQSLVASRLLYLGGQPDFVFCVVITAALLSDAGTGSVLGLVGGLLTAALVGETVGTFLVSRTLAGFVAGWFSSRLFRTNAGVIVLSVLAASVTAETVYALAAPRVGLMPWLWSALIGTAYNVVLALPLTYLLRRLGWGRDRI